MATGFKPLPLNAISWFQNLPFKFNLRHYTTVLIEFKREDDKLFKGKMHTHKSQAR
jgi:hypothetical protein